MTLIHPQSAYNFIEGRDSDPQVSGENGFLVTLDIHEARRLYDRTLLFEERQDLTAIARGLLEQAGYNPSRGYGAMRFALKCNRASSLLLHCSFPARGKEGIFSLKPDYEEKLRWGQGNPMVYATYSDLTTQEADALKRLFKEWYKKFK